MLKKFILGSTTAVLLSHSSLYAKENTYLDNLSVGVQSTGVSATGLSVKYDVNEKITAQGIIGLLGEVTNYAVRGIYNFKQDDNFKYYGYASLGIWQYNDSYYNETSVGYGAGVGLKYDVRKLDKTFPPIFLSTEIGFDLINFDNYSYGGVDIGFGVHYKF